MSFLIISFRLIPTLTNLTIRNTPKAFKITMLWALGAFIICQKKNHLLICYIVIVIYHNVGTTEF